MSAEDIDKGSRGLDVIARELEATDFGIVVVTAENYARPWINFEAGALSKQLESSRVVPLLFGVEYAQMTGPLTQFQCVMPRADDIRRLVHQLNGATPQPLREALLDRSFDKWWVDLATALSGIETISPDAPRRDPAELLVEVLQVVRGIQRRMTSVPRWCLADTAGPHRGHDLTSHIRERIRRRP